MSDELKHLYDAHTAEQSRYIYFLLGATGAALGYALQKLDASTYGLPVWLGLFASGAWLLSFLFGCKLIISLQHIRYCNYELIRAQKKGYSSKVIKAAYAAIDANNNRVNFFSLWQFRLLAIGALLFTAWRIVVLFYGHNISP